MIRVYTASKLSTAPLWREIQKNSKSVFFHARWLRHNELKTADTPENAVRFWIEDEEDVSTADAVLVFANEGEHLRGALVEAGIALANGVPVIVVGKHSDYGTWQYHPGVRRAEHMAHALDMLEEMDELHRRLR